MRSDPVTVSAATALRGKVKRVIRQFGVVVRPRTSFGDAVLTHFSRVRESNQEARKSGDILLPQDILHPPSHGQVAPHSQVAPPIAFIMKLARAK